MGNKKKKNKMVIKRILIEATFIIFAYKVYVATWTVLTLASKYIQECLRPKDICDLHRECGWPCPNCRSDFVTDDEE